MKNYSADFERFLRQDAKRVAQSIPSVERISDAQAAKIRAVTAQLDTRREMPTFIFDPSALPTMDAIRFVVGKNPNMPLSRALVKTAGNAVIYPKISFTMWPYFIPSVLIGIIVSIMIAIVSVLICIRYASSPQH